MPAPRPATAKKGDFGNATRAKKRLVTARQPLTRERISLAALELIERGGLDAFSTRRLGAALGCEAMALYNHFPSKDAVLDAVVGRMMDKLVIPPRHANGWVERARAFARSYRGLSRLHPKAFPLLATRRFNTPSTLRLLDGIFAAFAEDGIAGRDAAYVFRTLSNFCGGTALDELAGLRQAAEAAPDWTTLGLPHLASAAPWLSPPNFDDAFEVGLDVLLGGLSRRIVPGAV